MITTAIPANGVDGVLIWVHGLDRFMFRVYNLSLIHI